MTRAYRCKPFQSCVLVLAKHLYGQITDFLRAKSADGREAAAYMLCGLQKTSRQLRLLSRSVVMPEDDCFVRRSAGAIELKKGLDNFLLERAFNERLVLVQVHTHLHDGPTSFSPVDDHYERGRAVALGNAGMPYLASCVFDRAALHGTGRLWHATNGGCTSSELRIACDVAETLEGATLRRSDVRFDRQVRAFGEPFQALLDCVRIGVVGVGGLGGTIVEGLARLGVRRFVLVDPDMVEATNLNRLPGATPHDAVHGSLKTDVAARNIAAMHGPRSRIRTYPVALPDKTAMRSLANCDVLVAATDNHASRLCVMELAAAYLRPVVNAGVGLVARDGVVQSIDIRAAAAPSGGPWCLACGGHIDAFEASREQMDAEHREMLRVRGYLRDTPAPAVYWVNLRAASEALRLVHGVLMPYHASQKDPYEDVFGDLVNLDTLRITHPEYTDGCAVCGGEGLRGLGDEYFRDGNASLDDLVLEDGSRRANDGEAEQAVDDVQAEKEEADALALS